MNNNGRPSLQPVSQLKKFRLLAIEVDARGGWQNWPPVNDSCCNRIHVPDTELSGFFVYFQKQGISTVKW